MKKYKILKAFLLILFVIGVGVIAFFPFANRDLTATFQTDAGVQSFKLRASDVMDGTFDSFSFSEATTSIQKLTFYDVTGTMYVKEQPVDSIYYNYIFEPENLGLSLDEATGYLMFGDTSSRTIPIMPEYNVWLREMISDFLQGRLILAGLYACVIAILFIGVNAAKEKKEDSWNNHGPIMETKKFIGDMKKYWQYMVYAAKADLKAEVANSYLNRLWWLLEPFFNMLVYVIVFGKVMGNNIENYATFTFSSLLMWKFFNTILNYSVKLVRNNRDIISKVYVPKFVILISTMILNMIKLLFSLIVLVAMLAIFRVHIGVNIIWVIPAYIVMILFTFGISMIFLHFGVYVDDLGYAVGILLNMAMFLSGIFYDVMTALPQPLNIIMMTINPMAMCMDTMRNALLYNHAANLPILGMWFVISVIMCYIGVHIVYKNENSYVKIV